MEQRERGHCSCLQRKIHTPLFLKEGGKRAKERQRGDKKKRINKYKMWEGLEARTAIKGQIFPS